MEVGFAALWERWEPCQQPKRNISISTRLRDAPSQGKFFLDTIIPPARSESWTSGIEPFQMHEAFSRQFPSLVIRSYSYSELRALLELNNALYQGEIMRRGVDRSQGDFMETFFTRICDLLTQRSWGYTAEADVARALSSVSEFVVPGSLIDAETDFPQIHIALFAELHHGRTFPEFRV